MLALLVLAGPPATAAQGVDARIPDSVASWRAAFRSAGEAEGLRTFLELMKEAVDRGPADPTVLAFHATAEVMTAGRKGNPLAKLLGFRKWTGRLDRQVEASPDHPDIRLLRLAVRSKAPSFLGYRDGIGEDCRVVSEALESGYWEGDPDHGDVASHLLNSVKACR